MKNNCMVCLEETTTYISSTNCFCKMYGHLDCIEHYINRTNQCFLCKKQFSPVEPMYINFIINYLSYLLSYIDQNVSTDYPFLFILFILLTFTSILLIVLPLYLCFFLHLICSICKKKKYKLYNITE